MKIHLLFGVKLLIISFLSLFDLEQSNAGIQNDSLVFHEGFEDGNLPNGWEYEYVKGTRKWQYQDGGFTTDSDIEGSGYPPYAFQGNNNAMFHYESLNGEKTKLVTPPLNLEYIIKPELVFWHAQDERYTFGEFRNDELRVFVKKNKSSQWVMLAEYTDVIEEWKKRSLIIPDSLLSENVYIAFEGKTNNGYGACIDSVHILETGIISKYIDEIKYHQASTDFIPTESANNRILRIDFQAEGNDGELILDSLTATSLNTDDSNIKPSGVNLYASNDTIFSNITQIGANKNFIDGEVTFENINYDIPRGLSSVWITYDIDKDENHEMHNNIADAKIEANSIKINNTTYPLSSKSPEGYRVIYESLFYDDFEQDRGWEFSGEFERDVPQGLGGSNGNPDPDFAVSGDTVIGSDLTGLGNFEGDYEPEITDNEYIAASPLIDCYYFQDIYLHFNRWANVEKNDTARIQVKTYSNDWATYWQNESTILSSKWSDITYNLSNYLSRKDSARIRFTTGPTNDYWQFSGWNIDNVVITGKYIAQDVGIAELYSPLSGCGHSSEEDVIVEVANYGGDPTEDMIPLYYSLDGGETKVRDTIFQSIPVGESVTHTFSTPADLSQPELYPIKVQTTLNSDEASENDLYEENLLILPTYSPPYYEDFETTPYYFWQAEGENNTWEYGEPSASRINTAASGSNAWVTNLTDVYSNNDSASLESPCFNLEELRNPVFEVKILSAFQKDKDGMALYYSIDDGKTWNIITKNSAFDWNWYNSEYIEGLGTPGWDTTLTNWMTSKVFLPEAVKNTGQVKFRFLMQSDSSERYEGAAIDDIKIYEAPPDIGVTQIEYPTTQCYLSDSVQTQVYIKNTGIDTLFEGQAVPLRLEFKDDDAIKDTLVLDEFLAPDDSVLFTFNQTVDMSDSGDYAFKVYSVLEDDPYFYDSINNDTIIDTIAVQGIPNYDIGHVIGMPAPVDTVLDAGAGFETYQWGTGDTTRTYHVDDTTGWFYVTVTNSIGCTASDSVKVVDSETDVGVTKILSTIEDSCERNVPVNIEVEISNMGFLDFEVGDTLPIAYKVNDQTPVLDTIILDSILTTNAPDSILIYTFSENIDLNEPEEYNIDFYTNIEEDYDHRNDTSSITVNTWGYPDVDLGYDTLITGQADSLILDAGEGFDTYAWQDGSSSQTYDINHNRSQWYKVSVTDVHGCGSDADSMLVIANDIGIDSLVAPMSSCELTKSENVEVQITNFSEDTLREGKSIPLVLEQGDTIQFEDTISLAEDFHPSDSRNFMLPSTNVDVSEIGEHSFRIWHQEQFDIDRSNDTLTTTIETYGYPEANIVRDTIYTSRADTIQLFPGEGFKSYVWKADDSNDTLSINDTLYVSDQYSRKYYITVEDEHGCGSDTDSVQVFTYNMGISEMVDPSTDCELSEEEDIRISIKNYSQDTIKTGETLDITMVYDNDTINDAKTFDTNLNPGGTFTHTFSQPIDMSEFKTFHFDFFTNHPYDVDRSNDTLKDAVETHGYPEFSLNIDTLYTTQADTVVLYTDIDESSYSYLWQDGSNSDTFHVSNKASATYMLTVSDIHGCSTSDTAEIITYDVGVDSITSFSDDCEHPESEDLTVALKNYGYDTLEAGTSIPLSYKFNNGSKVSEEFVLSDNLMPQASLNYTFSQTFNLSDVGTYDFIIWSEFKEDVYAANDTLNQAIRTYGYPDIDLGSDTIFTSQPDTILLEPGYGYDDYLWQDGSTKSTFDITENITKMYSVTVTNEGGCSVSDSTQVIAYNLDVINLLSPESACERSESEPVIVEIVNHGDDVYKAGDNLIIEFEMNEYEDKDTLSLEKDLYPEDTLVYQFDNTVDISSPGIYSFTANVYYGFNENYSDNEFTKNVYTYGDPLVDLGPDTVVTAISYTLDPGDFESYEWHDGSNSSTFTVTEDNQTDDHLYSVTVTDQYGCQGSDTAEVMLNIIDMSVTSINSPTSVCNYGDSLEVEIELTNSGNTSIVDGITFPLRYNIKGVNNAEEEYELEEPLEAGNSINYTFSTKTVVDNPGEQDISASVNYEDDVYPDNDKLEETFQVFALPDIDFESDTIWTEDFPITLDPGNFSSYEWQDGSTNRTYEVQEEGTYWVRATNQFGCSATDTVVVAEEDDDTPESAQSIEDTDKINIYPNPARDKIFIELDINERLLKSIRLVDATGAVVYAGEDIPTDELITIDTKNFARGVYYMVIQVSNEVYQQQVILH